MPRKLLPALTLSLLLVLATAATADAEVLQYRGYQCVGENAYRCGWMNIDTPTTRCAAITDLSHGGVGVVQIGAVRLYRAGSSSGPWTEIAQPESTARVASQRLLCRRWRAAPGGQGSGKVS